MNNLDFHKPVMLTEMLKNLAPKSDETYLDATFGAGGYSKAILESAKCKLYAIDRDESAKKFAKKLEEKFGKNFVFISGKFSEAEKLLQNSLKSRQAEPDMTILSSTEAKMYKKHTLSEEHRKIAVDGQHGRDFREFLDGMVLDIGVSSMQFDDKERGFSFDSDAKLDMRMDQKTYPSAYEIVNESSEEELAKIIKEFGEEPKAKRIAKKIIEARKSQPVTSCRDLACIVRSQYFGYSKTDPATRTFQALRIFVNQELDELKAALASSVTLLKKGGRLVVVSFHSLEDSIVKNFLKKESGLDQTFSRYQPISEQKNSAKNFQVITKSAISPSKEEIASNPRARSSKMRVAIKL